MMTQTSDNAIRHKLLHADAAVIGLVGFAHGTSHFFQLLMPPLFPWLMREFGLNFTEVAALMTVVFVISGCGQALAGFPVDRFGPWRVLCCGIATLILSALVLSVATSYAQLMLAAVLTGLGNCVFHPADFTLLNRRVSPARLGHAFSIHGLSGYLGWAVIPPLLVGIAGFAGWRSAALAATGVGALSLALLWRHKRLLDDRTDLNHEHAAEAAAAPPSSRSFDFLRSRPVWLCFSFFVVATMALGVLQNFAPVLLREVYGLSLNISTSCLTAYLLGSAGGMASGGFLAARGAHERVIAAALGTAAAVALLLASGIVPWWAVPVIMAVMGFGVGLAGPSRDLLVRRAATQSIGRAAFGRVYGFVYSGMDAGFSLVPLIVGPLLDTGHYSLVLYAIALLQFLAVAAALMVGAGSRPASMNAFHQH